jgi:hypothetical protein
MNQTEIAIQVRGFSVYSTGLGKLILEKENGDILFLDIKKIKTENECTKLYYVISLSEKEAVQFFSFFIEKEHEQEQIYLEKSNYIRVNKINPEMKIKINFENKEEARSGTVILGGLKLETELPIFWRASWEINNVNLWFLPKN